MRKAFKVGIPIAVVLVGWGGLAALTGAKIPSLGCIRDSLGVCLSGRCEIPVAQVTCAATAPTFPNIGSYGQMSVQDFNVCRARPIVWQLTDKSLKFPDNGIELKGPDAGNFVPNEKRASGPEFFWKDRYVSVGQIPYAVTVQKANGQPCARLDPVVYND